MFPLPSPSISPLRLLAYRHPSFPLRPSSFKPGTRRFYHVRHLEEAGRKELGNKVASRYTMIRLPGGQGAVQLPSCIIAPWLHNVKEVNQRVRASAVARLFPVILLY